MQGTRFVHHMFNRVGGSRRTRFLDAPKLDISTLEIPLSRSHQNRESDRKSRFRVRSLVSQCSRVETETGRGAAKKPRKPHPWRTKLAGKSISMKSGDRSPGLLKSISKVPRFVACFGPSAEAMRIGEASNPGPSEENHKVVSYNGSGWRSCREIITRIEQEKIRACAVFLQETKLTEDNDYKLKEEAQAFSWKTIHTGANDTEKGGVSSGVAILVKSHIGVQPYMAENGSDAFVIEKKGPWDVSLTRGVKRK